MMPISPIGLTCKQHVLWTEGSGMLGKDAGNTELCWW